ncbi:MAG: ABC transporter permease [Dehalococcoidia bacterium]
MGMYLARRFTLLVPTLLLISIVVFTLMRFIPGDAVQIMVEQRYGDSEAVVRRQLGLDRPLIPQYLTWMSGVVRGDFGRSIWNHRPIMNDLILRGQVTIEIAFIALLLILLIGIPAGIISAIRPDSIADYAVRVVATLGLAVPVFWLGTLALVLPSIWFHYSPPVGYVALLQDPVRNLQKLAVPAVLLAISGSAASLRMMRASMIEVLHQDYVRTARAKGLTERRVLSRHAVRNALIPTITLIGNQLPFLIGGSVIIETLFSIPGLGFFLFDSINRRDYPVVQAVNLALATVVLLVNLAVDVGYGLLDPRIRFR